MDEITRIRLEACLGVRLAELLAWRAQGADFSVILPDGRKRLVRAAELAPAHPVSDSENDRKPAPRRSQKGAGHERS